MTRALVALVLTLAGLAPSAAAEQSVSALAPFETLADGFVDVRGIVVDAAGDVFVADRASGIVWRIASDGTRVAVATGLERPVGLALDPRGRLLIAEERAARVARVEADGSLTTLVSGVKQPRWLAVREDGTLYMSARHLITGGTDLEPDDESAEPEMVLALSPGGTLSVFAGGFRQLQGIAVNHQALYAATTGLRSDPRADGVIFEIAILPSGAAGPPQRIGASDEFTKPLGLARDRFGALYLTTKEVTLAADRSRRAVAKLHPDAHVTLFAENFAKPEGLAFDVAGNLYVADGDAGRVLRFAAPARPALTTPAFTTQATLAVTGTTQARARVDVFVDAATIAASGPASGAGAFSVAVRLTANTPNTLEAFATGHGGDGLTSAPTEVTVTHDATPPALLFTTPPANAHVRLTALVQAQATDANGVASLGLTVDGQPLVATLTPAPPASPLSIAAAWDTSTVADGSHTLGASATDRAGNPRTATRVVIIDNTPPDTTITGGPSGEIAVAIATFSFTGIDNLTPAGGLAFGWRLDGGAWTAFSDATTAALSGLTEGAHTFEVKARDLAGNDDPTPAARTFSVRFGPSIADVSPSGGTIGTLVTITGVNFEPGATTVSFNGLAAAIRMISPTVITTTVPIGAATGALLITTTRGFASRMFTVTLKGDFALTVDPASLRAIAGDQSSAHVAATGGGNFSSLVAVGVAPAVAGVTASFGAPFVAPGASTPLTFRVDTSVSTGTYAFTVTGSSSVDGRVVTRTAPVSLQVLPRDTHAVTGRIMTAESLPQPIPGVSVALGSAFVPTDVAGNFVLLAPPVGPNMLFVDGRTASTPEAQFPIVEVQIDVAVSGPTRVPFTIYLPKLDTANAINLPLDGAGFTTRDVKATTPSIPGLEVTIPPGTRIIGPDGNPVGQLVITRVPIDRSPMPFPPGITFPLLFAINPGGAVPSNPLPISFPNAQGAAPGTTADLYYFDLSIGNWNVWGTGATSDDGRQIVSDPGFGLPRLAWHGASSRPSNDQVDSGQPNRATGGEPVDLPTGRFTVSKTDVTLPGRLPISIGRFYRSESAQAGILGIGWALEPYETVLLGRGATLVLIRPDQSEVVFAPGGPGQWQNTTDPTLVGAVITSLPGDFVFQLRSRDGIVRRFERISGFANLAGLAAITDRNGNSITLTRAQVFQQNRITSISDGAGRGVTLAYDTSGRVVSITDPIGRVVGYDYDTAGRIRTVTDAAGGRTSYTYDTNHRITTITDPRSIVFLTNEYDAQGRVVRQAQADGGVYAFDYSVIGALVTETVLTSPLGRATRYRFNAFGQTVSETNALGQTTTYEYASGTNRLLAITDGLGRRTEFAYDGRGNVVAITDPLGNVRRSTYDVATDLPTTVSDPLGNPTTFSYDAGGNVTAVAGPTGMQTALVRDATGDVRAIIDPLGNRTTLSYDAHGALVATTDPVGATTTFTYDGASRLTSQTDPRGRTTTFSYDNLNRLIAITDALGAVKRMTYDGNGSLIAVTDALGRTITHTYDVMDRLVARTHPQGVTETYGYDTGGRLVMHIDRNGRATTHRYDELDRRVGATYADGSVTTFRYDAAGRAVVAEDSAGGAVVHEYDRLDRLAGVQTTLGAVSYGYDALGRRRHRFATGVEPTTYTFDAASQLTRVDADRESVQLSYDGAGRLATVTLPNGVVKELGYDEASRLVSLNYRRGASLIGDLTYMREAGGEVTAVGGTFAATNLPPAIDGATYDDQNRQLTFGRAALTFDDEGNTTSIADGTGTASLRWDSRNRLVGLTRAGIEASFAYDVFGRRVRKTVDGVTTQYLYDGPDVAAEIRDGVTLPYFRLLGVDTPVARGVDEIYLTDALGTVIATSDAAGRVMTQYSYSPFGESASSGAASDNRLTFTAREADETGLMYYRARYYSPGLHRFLNQDLVLRLGANRYAYALNNPLSNADPFGLDTFVIYGGLASSGPGGSSAGELNRGLSNLVRTLGENGEPVFIFNSGQIDEVVARAREAARAGRPVYIVGHSRGGEAAVRAAAELLGLGITPDRVFTIDPFVDPSTTVPPGLPLTSFYQTRRYLILIRGFEIGGAEQNILITGTNHIDITSHPRVQEAIQGAILGASRAQPVGGRY